MEFVLYKGGWWTLVRMGAGMGIVSGFWRHGHERFDVFPNRFDIKSISG